MTMILRCSIEMPNISYAWKELKEQLGEILGFQSEGNGLSQRKAGKAGASVAASPLVQWLHAGSETLCGSFSLFHGMLHIFIL